MKFLSVASLALSAVFLTACGVETLGAAATSAVLKKEEAQERKKQMNRVQERLNEAQEQMAAKDRAARQALGFDEKPRDDRW